MVTTTVAGRVLGDVVADGDGDDVTVADAVRVALEESEGKGSLGAHPTNPVIATQASITETKRRVAFMR